MSTSEVKARGGGVGLPGLLFITFLVLKLTGVLTWSWWLVTAPLWGALALAVVLLTLGGALAVVVSLAQERRARKARQARLEFLRNRRLQ